MNFLKKLSVLVVKHWFKIFITAVLVVVFILFLKYVGIINMASTFGQLLLALVLLIIGIVVIEGYIWVHYRFYQSKQFIILACFLAFIVFVIFGFSYNVTKQEKELSKPIGIDKEKMTQVWQMLSNYTASKDLKKLDRFFVKLQTQKVSEILKESGSNVGEIKKIQENEQKEIDTRVKAPIMNVINEIEEKEKPDIAKALITPLENIKNSIDGINSKNTIKDLVKKDNDEIWKNLKLDEASEKYKQAQISQKQFFDDYRKEIKFDNIKLRSDELRIISFQVKEEELIDRLKNDPRTKELISYLDYAVKKVKNDNISKNIIEVSESAKLLQKSLDAKQIDETKKNLRLITAKVNEVSIMFTKPVTTLNKKIELIVELKNNLYNRNKIVNTLKDNVNWAMGELKGINDVKDNSVVWEIMKNALTLGLIALIVELMICLLFIYIIKGRHMVPMMFVMPAVLGLLALLVYPFFFEIVLAFSGIYGPDELGKWSTTGNMGFVPIDNFIRVFTESPLQKSDFWILLGRTFLWTFINVLFHVVGGFVVASFLNRELWLKGIYRTLILIPWAIPQVIAVLTWKNEFDYNYGFINIILTKLSNIEVFKAIGIGPVQWLADPFWGFAAVCIVNIWLGIPFMSVIILGGLQSISSTYYEAAEIDGATKFQRFRNITIPLVRPVVLPAVILGFLWTFNNINVIYLMTGGGGGQEYADILVTALYKSAFELYKFNISAAFALVIFVILAVFTFFYMRFTKKFEEIH